MKKARLINGAAALIAAVALCGNAAIDNSGWMLAGNIFGWVLIIGTLWLVVDHEIKERAQQ